MISNNFYNEHEVLSKKINKSNFHFWKQLKDGKNEGPWKVRYEVTNEEMFQRNNDENG